jgi:hypothetical protein
MTEGLCWFVDGVLSASRTKKRPILSRRVAFRVGSGFRRSGLRVLSHNVYLTLPNFVELSRQLPDKRMRNGNRKLESTGKLFFEIAPGTNDSQTLAANSKYCCKC